MKANETASTPAKVVTSNPHRRYRYQKICDGRKQPIRGLWKRNGKYVARITVESDLDRDLLF